MSKITNGGLT